MARRKATYHELPEWFDLKAYDALLGIDNESLIKEVACRSYLNSSQDIGHDAMLYDLEPLTRGDVLLEQDAVYDDDDIPEMMNSEIVSIGPDFIAPGIPRTTIAPLPEPVEKPEDEDREKLPGDNCVWPTSFMELQGANVWAQMRGIFGPGKPGPGGYVEIKTEYMLASLSAHLRNGRIETTIDLEGSTDAEILAELTELLPRWRERLGLPEPAKHESGATGPSIIKRLIEYRVIPMLDLMIWAKMGEFEYSAGQLSRALYPNEIVTAKHVSDTRQPFAMKFADEDYADMVKLWLRQTDRGTGKRNGERLVKDTIAMP